MRRARLLTIYALMLAARPVFAQLPSGYYEVSTTPLPDSLRETMRDGRFSIEVMRAARNAMERKLIERAESVLPSKDSIERRAARMNGAGNVAAAREAAALTGSRWWWRDWDGVLRPFALTGATVVHYVDRVRTLSEQPNPFANANPGVDHRASMEYSARVVWPDDRTGEAEVHLQLKYGSYCGPVCGLSFMQERIVDFDRNGTMVRVRGDGPPRIEVS